MTDSATQPPCGEIRPSATCIGEKCWCGSPAAKKVSEEIAFDDPTPARHNLTAYVCADHYAEMMGPIGAQQVGIDHAAIRALKPTATIPADVVAGLSDALPGHWNTEGGRRMAIQTLGDRYMVRNRERQPDMQLANDVFLSPGISNLTAAKERIRWLSAMLAAATGEAS